MKKFLKSVLGEFSYRLPSWLVKLISIFSHSALGRALGQFLSTRKTAPKDFFKKSILGVVVLALLGTGSYFGYAWWKGRPQPRLVTFRIEKPGITNLETEEAESLVIKFSQSVAKLEDLNRVLSDRVKLKPEVPGSWSWHDDSTLKFKPDFKTRANWAVGTEYEFSFKKALFPDHIRLNQFDGEFTTDPLKITYSSQEFYIDPKDPKVKKGNFKIYFSHPVQSENLKEHLKLTISPESGISVSKKVNYSLQMNKFSTEASVSSEALVIDDRPQTLKVSVEKGFKPKQAGKPAPDGKDLQVTIPGRLTAFTIQSVDMEVIRNQKYEPEQIILVRTSLDAKSEDVAAKIRLRLFPADRAAGGEFEKEVKNYPWSSASEITDEVVKKMTDMSFTLIPSEHTFSKVHSFKVNTKPEMFALVEVKKGLLSLGEFVLNEDSTSVVQIKPYPEEISIMSDGALLSLSGELKVPMMARNARTIQVQLSRVIPEQVNHLLSQISYDIKKPYLGYEFENKTSENFVIDIPLSFESAQATQFFSFDLAGYLHKLQAPKGIFIVKATVIRPDKSRGPTDERLIMVTDLGLLVKETQSQSHEIFVQNLRSGLSVKGAQIEVIGRNGLTVLSANTDQEGHVTIPKLNDFKNEKEPIAFAVKVGGDQAFLPFRNSKQNLQYSRFDVGGLFESARSEQLNSMLFSDRGIYRPGEQVNIGLILRSKNAKFKNQKIPLEWSASDPQGNVVTKEIIQVNADDFRSLQFKTEETAPVGTYDVSLHLIKKNDQREFIGHETVRVEEFQPDRLKIRTSISKEKLTGWVKVQDLKASVVLRNLFGSPAEDRLIRAKLVLTPQQPYFKGYEQFQFTHFDQTDLQVQNDELKEQKTNAQGETEFELKLSSFQAPYFSLRFDAEGFEAEAGKSVRASSSVMLSTLDFMIGAKPDGDLGYIRKDAERNLQLIALDADLKKIAAKDLTLEIIERKYISVLTQAENGNYKYQSVLKLNSIKTTPLNLAEAGSQLTLDTKTAGDFYLSIKNKDSIELLKLAYTVAGAANLARTLDRNAELQLVLNKKDYKIGEEIEMQIKAPYQGAGLVSIERDGIYQFKWFKTDTSSTVQKIKVPEGLSGNAYVTVTFLRAIDSKEIFMSPLSYAVAPFSISLEDRKTTITLKAPEKIKPGQKLKIEYSANHLTDMILYGVDEGILQVAQYKLPNPLGFFFQKRALQVKTYQMLDLLMPEFSLIQQGQAPGGDDGAGALGKNLNPFRSRRALPIAFWSGVIKADAKVRSYTYDVPDYFNGNIKIMAVAANALTLGAEQTSSFVRGDFIMTPSAPVFVAPLDQFKVGLTVANQKEKSGEKAAVKLAVKPNRFFEIVDKAEQTLEISEGREVATSISIKAVNNVGEGELVFEAKHESSLARAKADISVRPAVPYQNLLQVNFTQDNSFELTEKAGFFEAFSKHSMSVSYSPLSIGTGLQGYLESYPYGCTEQVISRTWPSILMTPYLSNATSRNKKLIEKQKENVKSITRILRSRQSGDGGFSLYERAGAASFEAASLYAIQFLIEIQDRKLADVSDMLQKARPYLQSLQVSRNVDSLEGLRSWGQALYLAARLKVVNGASLNALKQELQSRFKDTWQKDPAAFYLAATYKLYKQDDEAENLFKNFRLGESAPVKENFYQLQYFDSLSSDGILIYLSALYAGPSYAKLIEPEPLKKLLTSIVENRYQSFSAAQLLLAFDAMEQRGRSQAVVPLVAELKAQIENQWQKIDPQNTQTPMLWSLPIRATQVQFSSNAKEPLFYAYHKAGFPDQAETKEVKSNIEVIRQMKDLAGQDVKSVRLGDEVRVILALRTTDEKSHAHIAIVDLLPGGFELIPQKDLNRLDSGGAEGEGPDGIEGEDQESDSSEGEEGANHKYEQRLDQGYAFWNLVVPRAYAQAATSNLAALVTDFIDQREDRIVVYATLTPEVTAFEYRMKAVAEGKFRVPAAFAEGMYNRDLYFVGPTGWIEIKSEK